MTRRRRTSRYERALEARRAEQREHRRAARREARRMRPIGWWALAILLAAAAVGAALELGRPRRAEGAVRVPLAWTAPSNVGWYECRVRRQDGTVTSTALTGDSLGLAPVTIQPQGARQIAWALVSENWRAGGTTFRVRACNGAGGAPWSNPVVVLAGIPDTNWQLQRDGRSGYRAPVGGAVWKRANGRVAFTLQAGDTTVPATIVHQEVAQRAVLPQLCAAFGMWALRGGLQTCP